MEFKDSQTYKNLTEAYDRELKTSGQYRMFQKTARAEGYQQIGNVLDSIAIDEIAHAELWEKLRAGGKMPTTLENLKVASANELYVSTQMYVNFAKTAKDEGFDAIANLFEWVAKIEQHHEFIFNKFIQNINNNQVFCKESRVVWICLNCGNLIFDTCAPEVCPVCDYPQGWYELNCDNF